MPATTTSSGLAQLLRERVRLDAQVARYQQLITLLFVDIVSRPPDRNGGTSAPLPDLLEKLVALITDRGGVVVKTIEDAILARFDTPLEAVYSALDMQWSMLGQNAGKPEAEQVHVRIALHSGLGLLKDNSVCGDVVNVCARVASAGGGGDILISAPVYQEICDHEEIAMRKRAAPLVVKRKSPKLDLYEVIWRYAEN